MTGPTASAATADPVSTAADPIAVDTGPASTGLASTVPVGTVPVSTASSTLQLDSRKWA
jgi:hypothetical protein